MTPTGPSAARLLRRARLAAGAFAAAPLLAACGEVTTRSAAAVGTSEWWRGQHDTGRLVLRTWPLYIDYTNWLKDRPSLNGFSRHTGIEVTYEEVIEGNEPFFQKIAPRLQAGPPL